MKPKTLVCQMKPTLNDDTHTQKSSGAYMKLCLKSCPPTFTVLFFQFLNGTGESRGRDLAVSTGKRLQDSIVDEHILVLGGSQGERGHSVSITLWAVTQRIRERLIPFGLYDVFSLGYFSKTRPLLVDQLSVAYRVLDHLHALPPHLGDNGRNVHYTLSSSLLQSHVNGNQCACPPYASTACRERCLTFYLSS